jgi:alpha-galactosidase
MTHFRYRGEDAYPLIDAWIENESEAYWRDHQPVFYETQMSPAAIHLYKLYGLMPLGDTSRAIWPEAWWYNLDLPTKQRWWGHLGGFDSDEGWAIMLHNLENHLQKIRAVADDQSQRVSDIFPPKASGEQMVPIIDALANDQRGYFLVNVPNNGAIKGINDEVVVEVPAVVDGMGIHPNVVGELPQSVMLGAIWPQWLAMERRIAGFRNGDKRYLLQVLLSEQRTRSWEHAEAVLDAIMRMPGNEAMAAHFNIELSKEPV